ncbi:hypothetical protein LSTR_LSTR013986 [Laodelphax striatellus]|uniref:Uncharacterized protein n=1 Tax=Laodelphax striatellus TaxID=195883 RepID=A0A482XGU2_LAOST|nr:hypothetical protein LSTR_LSTR013986 [Laodelphax striatellus]
MMSVTLIVFLVILVIAIFSRKTESAPVSAEIPETRSLKQLDSITKCPFEVKEDYDPERTPQRIQKVVCKPIPCQDCDAEFHCVQATVEFEVFYKSGGKPSQLPIEYGCYYTKLDAESVEINNLPEVST